MHIRYTTTDCPLGRLLVAATERGMCAVKLGDKKRALDLLNQIARQHPSYEEIERVQDDIKRLGGG